MPRRSNGPVYYKSKHAWFANVNKEQIKLIEGFAPKFRNATKKSATQ
jgi:hypothetical protein